VPPPLRVGDRVRLTANYRGSRFRPGATGTVVKVLPPGSPQGVPRYQVRVDTGEVTFYSALDADELELWP
jgi:hypothetical protein